MRVANRHILLFIDNCSSHVSVAGLTNVKLIFFPPNCTSKLHPADQGIIQNVKVHYRKTMIRRMLQCLDAFESDEEEETDESDGGLWGSITHHCPALAEVSFSDFVSLDKNVVTECQPTDQEATREALEAIQSVDSANHEKEDDDDLDDDISVLEQEPLSPIEATEAVSALRNFVMTFDKSGAKEQELLRSLSSMEDTFLRMQARRQRQSSLEEFFH